MRLPNLFVIGAAKSGTTSLHYYLSEHPAIHMARGTPGVWRAGRLAQDDQPKEMRFFWRDDWREHLHDYAAQFDVCEAVRGEATPAYSAWPYHPGVPERIHEVAPEARFIYIVRDPIDRVIAHSIQEQVAGRGRPLERRLREPGWENDRIVCPSRYATQLERYLSLFAPDRILVEDQRELRNRRREALREIFSFLEVDPGFWSASFEREYNTLGDKRALTRSGRVVFRQALDPAAARLAPELWRALRPRVRRVFSRPVEWPQPSDPVRAQLATLLAPEADRLRCLTGRRFDGWSV
jgi:hypothetical protein